MSRSSGKNSLIPHSLRSVLLWSHGNERRWPRYIYTIAIALGLIWGLAIAYLLLTPPSYSSKWTLILPGKGASSNLNLVNIGQASTGSPSPYSNSATNPRSNYKELITSSTVIRMAAKRLGMAPRQFGAPRVKLVDQTSLIYLSIKGNSPERARSKATALHEAFTELLDRLRSDELEQQEMGGNGILITFQRKLQEASTKLLKYQSDSNIVSMKQFDQLVLTLEQFRREMIETRAELEDVQGRSNQLVSHLGVNPQQASDALILQNDKLFSAALKEYTDARQRLNTNASKWDRNHPEVRKEQARVSAAKEAMNRRINTLLKARGDKLIDLLTLAGDMTRNALLQELIAIDAERNGLQKRLDKLSVLITEMEHELNLLTRPAAMLDDLKRNHQVAEAVFISALASTDIAKSDIYVSFPLVQLLDEPLLPTEPSSPNSMLTIAGAFVASIFTLTGLILMWIRKPFLRRILKNA
ncbi:MAG: hypothetical protein KZQ99_05560 [Candidatus Thiodiazotropha sp. (ex Dulcina madagascariensis)]|nr:hypothetical protein [Candidatus Thiodiazotropha sp. (ex Dulcina madagascariensis)]